MTANATAKTHTSNESGLMNGLENENVPFHRVRGPTSVRIEFVFIYSILVSDWRRKINCTCP